RTPYPTDSKAIHNYRKQETEKQRRHTKKKRRWESSGEGAAPTTRIGEEEEHEQPMPIWTGWYGGLTAPRRTTTSDLSTL
ncbi:hypothetical protein A2U01_0075647, partial [Trifolium medium]|nr:hypothetical protein [Trifolium medium]